MIHLGNLITFANTASTIKKLTESVGIEFLECNTEPTES